MVFFCLKFVQRHLFCTWNHSNSNKTKFKILPLCPRTHFHYYDHVRATSQDTGNPLAWARSTGPVIFMSQPATSFVRKNGQRGEVKSQWSAFLNGDCLVCLLFGLLIVRWKRDFHFYVFSTSSSSSSSSSIGTTAHCGLWAVEKCPSIFSYPPPTLSIFSLPPLEDLLYFPLHVQKPIDGMWSSV